jgi:hypothetical protein
MNGQCIFEYYTGKALFVEHGELAVEVSWQSSVDKIRPIYTAIILMSASFGISAIYYKIDALYQLIAVHFRALHLRSIFIYMTRYTTIKHDL